MSTPSQHPSPEVIVDFARGALEPGRALVLRCHLMACAECAGAARLAEAVGGVFLEDMEAAEMASDALAQVLARIDGRPPTPPGKGPVKPDDWIRVPREILEAAERRRTALPGVWVSEVTNDAATGARSYLLGVGAGIAVPLHTHKGAEYVCVLKGAYKDRGTIHRLGDFAENDGDVRHQPRVTRDGECVCLIAADNLLVPLSLQAKMLQPLVGI